MENDPAALTPEPKALNLGCGNTHDSDPLWLHHDRIAHHPNVRLIGDLENVNASTRLYWNRACGKFWFSPEMSTPPGPPFLERIVARDVLEHLQPKCIPEVLEFCWNNLKPGGTLEIQVPQHGSENAVIDPTHYRGFHLRSFDYWDRATSLGRNTQFYGRSPWKLEVAEVVPQSRVNLRFVLRKA